jgi:hypothetical protein
MFVPLEPEAIWPFVLKWRSHDDEDVRMAIATCLLEDLLQHRFDFVFPRGETAAKSNNLVRKNDRDVLEIRRSERTDSFSQV